MLKRTIMGFAVIALMLGGCVSTGNKVLKTANSRTVSQKIIRGETTKEQVRAAYGDPISTSFTDSGNEIWKYEWDKTHSKIINFIPLVNLFASGFKGKKKELTVFFNQKGIVKNYAISSSKIDTNTSLFQ